MNGLFLEKKNLKYSFKKKTDLRGDLIAIDSEFDLPFDIKRIFYIMKMDKLERGFHAHRKCIQLLIPIQGSFRLKLFDGEYYSNFFLDKSNEGVIIPIYHWLSMCDFSEDCIINFSRSCLVLFITRINNYSNLSSCNPYSSFDRNRFSKRF